ncbi:MAG: hypothetical protein IPP74_01330 [Alphaproteobacteria bacterium]|nr:hypothetical protein [Alphaproteobacteria bacterium]
MIELPKELKAILDATDFEDGGIEIIAMELLGNDLNLKVELWDDLDGFPRQQWKLECRSVKDYKLQPSNKVGLEVITEHPLLFPHNKAQSELFFNGTTDKLKELLADLVIAHNKIVGTWFSLEDFVHQMPCITHVPYIKNNDFKFGLLAKGPDIVMQEYLKVIDQYKIQANIINQRESKIWDGATWVASTNDNVVLFVGDNYFITNSIQVTNIS